MEMKTRRTRTRAKWRTRLRPSKKALESWIRREIELSCNAVIVDIQASYTFTLLKQAKVDENEDVGVPVVWSTRNVQSF